MPQQGLTEYATTGTNTICHNRDKHSIPQQRLTQHTTTGTNTAYHNRD